MSSQQNRTDMAKIWFSTDSGVSVGTAHAPLEVSAISFPGGKAPVVRALAATASGEIWLIADDSAPAGPHDNSCTLWRITPPALEAHQILAVPKYLGQKLVIDAFGYLWVALAGPGTDQGKIIELTPTGEVAAEFDDLAFVPEHLAYTSDDTVWTASGKTSPRALTPADGKHSEIKLSVERASISSQDNAYVLHAVDSEEKSVSGRRVTLTIDSDYRSKVSFVGYAHDQSYAKTLTTDSKGMAEFFLRATSIGSEGPIVRVLALTRGMAKPVEVYSGRVASPSAIDVAIADLRGTFFSGASAHIDIKGTVSGGGLNDKSKPDGLVTLSIKGPGESNFAPQDRSKVKWESTWSDGWHFTITGVQLPPGDKLPKFDVQASVSSHFSNVSTALFPLGAYLPVVEFRDDDGMRTEALSVDEKTASLRLHLACRHPLDRLSAHVQLTGGVKAGALKSIPEPLEFNSNWDGHLQTLLFTIKEGNNLTIPTGQSSHPLDILVPIKVNDDFLTGTVKVTLQSNSLQVGPDESRKIEASLLLSKGAQPS
ncbi:hypothetical protein [Burkholderia ambifaria]|uniref:Uncharacterized protein n=1 Tax=Burkholderia ambifaria MEX-5 TaxID=396597 RepID=B1TEC2_9BURK|nr:hypothetical protein [Burkholderia ambifaria]EDT38090.1 hypothetical protein BamMEX5DRAFT_6138 [Burkholderia ambifaria MEX-5]